MPARKDFISFEDGRGLSLVLDAGQGERSGRYVQHWSGFGLPNAEIYSRRVPFERGISLYDGFEWQNRIVNLTVIDRPSLRAEQISNRQKLYDHFNLNHGEGLLIVHLRDEDNLELGRFGLKCHYLGQMDFSTREVIGGVSQRAIIQLLALDVFWHNLDQKRVSYRWSTGGEVAMMAAYVDGQGKAYPRMSLEGPITNPKIELYERPNVEFWPRVPMPPSSFGNVLAEIELSHMVAAGSVVDIDCNPGQKAVTKRTTSQQFGEGSSIMADLTKASEFFSLSPGWVRIDITGTGSAETKATNFAMSWYDRHLGI